jgi:hypothetical protein
MRTGRPAKEKWAALEWLKIYMSRGPVLVAQLKQDKPTGWKTIETAKAELGIKSQKTKQGWLWYMPDAAPSVTKLSQAHVVSALTQPINPNDELEESDGIVVGPEEMKSIVDEMVLAGKSYKETERSLIMSCAQWPANPPHSVEYIKTFAQRRYNGLPTKEN